MKKPKSINEMASAKRESRYLDFKESFDVNNTGEWCEIIKDIVAMANSGGGLILIGVKNNGVPSEFDMASLSELDPAKITDKIAKYTGEQNINVRIGDVIKNDCKVISLEIDNSPIPIVFTKPGTYEESPGKQKTAFSMGTIYFRHGAKSEPANNNDIKESLEREIERVRKSWLGNIRKVVTAPPTYNAVMLPPEVKESVSVNATPIRTVDTNDPSLPVYRKEWNESAYQSPQEIIIGALKSWKRDKTSYASESDMWTLYKNHKNISLNTEKAECLLECAINRHISFFFWATAIPLERLIQLIKSIVKNGRYPAPNMAARLSHAIGGEEGKALLDYVDANCKYRSVVYLADRLSKTIAMKDRIYKEYGSRIKLGSETIVIDDGAFANLHSIWNKIMLSDDKDGMKQFDRIIYANKLGSRDDG